MANFDFLKNDYPNLFLLCSDADKYRDSDKSISMLKARQAIEYIVKYLGTETGDLYANINNLEDKNIAGSQLIELFHFIRKKANRSVHNVNNADTKGVLDALDEICVWLAVGHDKKSISITKFTDKEKYFLNKYRKIEVEDFEKKTSCTELNFNRILPYAERGNSKEQYRLAECYENGIGTEKDEEKAFEWYRKSAEQGNAEAQFKLAVCYDEGHGTSEDAGKAFEWYKKSAEQGNAEAQFKLAACYGEGHGTELDKEKAFDWYSLLAEQGNADAQYHLAECYRWRGWESEEAEEDEYKAFEWYEISAEQGNADALYQLAKCYENGYATCKDEKMALELYKKAAEQGNADAQYELAVHYEIEATYRYNHGTKMNQEKAFEWCKKAAEQGNAKAQYELAQYYRRGFGTEVDILKALEWQKKSEDTAKMRIEALSVKKK